MQVPEPLEPYLNQRSLTRLVQGAAVGAVLTMIIGFQWGGWTLSSNVAKQLEANNVSHRADICALKYMQQPNAVEQFAALQKISGYSEKNDAFDKGKWTTTDYSDRSRCMERIEAAIKVALAAK